MKVLKLSQRLFIWYSFYRVIGVLSYCWFSAAHFSEHLRVAKLGVGLMLWEVQSPLMKQTRNGLCNGLKAYNCPIDLSVIDASEIGYLLIYLFIKYLYVKHCFVCFINPHPPQNSPLKCRYYNYLRLSVGTL